LPGGGGGGGGPGIWPSPGHPAHPIAPGGTPPPGVVQPPIYYPPGVWVPTFPTNPIVIPEPPEGGGGGEGGEQPPGVPVHPITPPEGYVIVWVPGYGYVLAPVNPPSGSGQPTPTPHGAEEGGRGRR